MLLQECWMGKNMENDLGSIFIESPNKNKTADENNVG